MDNHAHEKEWGPDLDALLEPDRWPGVVADVSLDGSLTAAFESRPVREDFAAQCLSGNRYANSDSIVGRSSRRRRYKS